MPEYPLTIYQDILGGIGSYTPSNDLNEQLYFMKRLEYLQKRLQAFHKNRYDIVKSQINTNDFSYAASVQQRERKGERLHNALVSDDAGDIVDASNRGEI